MGILIPVFDTPKTSRYPGMPLQFSKRCVIYSWHPITQTFKDKRGKRSSYWEFFVEFRWIQSYSSVLLLLHISLYFQKCGFHMITTIVTSSFKNKLHDCHNRSDRQDTKFQLLCSIYRYDHWSLSILLSDPGDHVENIIVNIITHQHYLCFSFRKFSCSLNKDKTVVISSEPIPQYRYNLVVTF